MERVSFSEMLAMKLQATKAQNTINTRIILTAMKTSNLTQLMHDFIATKATACDFMVAHSMSY
jgi:hypothetical protein